MIKKRTKKEGIGLKTVLEEQSRGIFSCEEKKLHCSVEEIIFCRVSKTTARATLTLESENQTVIRGFVPLSGSGIIADPPEFEGMECELTLTADLRGREGTWQETFCVSTDHGEICLPCRMIDNGEAEEEREELRREQESFTERLWLLEDRLVLEEMRQGCKGTEDREWKEQYETETGKKEPVFFYPDRDRIVRKSGKKENREHLCIRRTTEGFSSFTVTCEGNFLYSEREYFTTDDFVDGEFGFDLFIRDKFLAPGENRGMVKILCDRQEILVSVEITMEPVKEEDLRREIYQKLERLYLSFRKNECSIGEWVFESEKLQKQWSLIPGEEAYSRLFEAHLLYAGGKKSDAFAVLEEWADTYSRIHDPKLYGYYLYLTTFVSEDISYFEQVEEELTRLMKQNRELWGLVWFLIYVREEFQQIPEKRLKALFSCIAREQKGEVLLLEAALIYRRIPKILTRLGRCEREVLRYACQEHLMTRALASQIIVLASQKKEYSQDMLEILRMCADEFGDAVQYEAVARMMILGNQTEETDREWYLRAIERGVEIPGIYEGYLNCLRGPLPGMLPEPMRSAFVYSSVLSSEKKAYVYRNIHEYRMEDPKTWEKYAGAVQMFTEEQAKAGAFGEDLAYLYENCLPKDRLTPVIARKLAKLFFRAKITVEEDGCFVFVVSPERGSASVLTPVKKTAWAEIYLNSCTHVLVGRTIEDRKSGVGLVSVEFPLKREELYRCCRKLVPDALPFILADFEESCLLDPDQEHSSRKQKILLALYRQEKLSGAFTDVLWEELLCYYLERPTEAGCISFLETVDETRLSDFAAEKLIFVYLVQKQYQKAWNLMQRCGVRRLKKEQETALLFAVLGREDLLLIRQSDDFLRFAFDCYASGEKTEVLIRFLLERYSGPQTQLRKLWQTGKQMGLHTREIEAKILTRALFEGNTLKGTERIFLSFEMTGGKKLLSRAYINRMSYESFIRDEPVEEAFFEWVEKELDRGRLPGICRIAWLYHMSAKESFTFTQMEKAGGILKEQIEKGRYFRFYQALPQLLQEQNKISHLTFAEIWAEPDVTVVLKWKRVGSMEDYKEQKVKRMVGPVFCAGILLFAGEEAELIWEITDPDHKIRTIRDKISGRTSAGEAKGRFAVLNRMAQSVQEQDDRKWEEAFRDYRKTEELKERIYQLML